MFKPNNTFSATSEIGQNQREYIESRRRVTVISTYYVLEVRVAHFETDT